MSDDTLDINIEELTIAEVVMIEELTGLPFDAMGDSSQPKGKMLQALAYISKRRTNPDFTWEQAGELKIDMASTEADPTDGDEP